MQKPDEIALNLVLVNAFEKQLKGFGILVVWSKSGHIYS